jgi:hypothetical protein
MTDTHDPTVIERVGALLPTLEEALARAFPAGTEPSLDGRDRTRLAQWLPEDQLHTIGMSLKEGATWTQTEWNAETVTAQLTGDVAFGFDKALGKRSISASCMHEVLEMWHRILRPPFDVPDYAHYGLPVIKAFATHFGLPDELGDDDGSEHRYSTYGD